MSQYYSFLQKSLEKSEAPKSKEAEKNVQNQKEPALKHQEPMTLPKKMPSSRKKKIIITALASLFVLLIAAGIFWLFLRKPPFSGENISFEISGPKELASGNEVDLTLSYANNEKVALRDAEINLVYPDGFIFESASVLPEKDSKNLFKKSKIEPGETDKITISGRLFGNPKDVKKFSVSLSFMPKNFRSRFSREADHDILISKSELQIEEEMPEIIKEDEVLKFSVKIRNLSESEIKNLRVKLETPSSFEISVSEPKISENGVVDFRNIKSNEEKEITVEGKLFGDVGETKTFKIQAGQLDEKEQFYVQNEKEVKVKIVKFEIDLEVSVSHESANQGDEIEFKVNYKNKSSENLPSASFSAALDENLFEKQSIQAEGGKYEKGIVTWDKTTKSEFADLEKNAQGTLSLRAKIASDIPMATPSDKNFSVKFKVKFEADLKEKGAEKFEYESAEAETKINTAVGYNIEIRYFDQSQKKPEGSGPLPPKVGQPTTYRVHLGVTNTTNDVDEAKVEVYLAKGVSFAEGKTASFGILDYFDGKVVWQIKKLSAGIGKLKPQGLASFDISITPDQSMVGKAPKLIEKSLFSGLDIFTLEAVRIERGNLTTELERDLKAKQIGGKVVE